MVSFLFIDIYAADFIMGEKEIYYHEMESRHI